MTVMQSCDMAMELAAWEEADGVTREGGAELWGTVKIDLRSPFIAAFLPGHFTITVASPLNQVEYFFGLCIRGPIRRPITRVIHRATPAESINKNKVNMVIFSMIYFFVSCDCDLQLKVLNAHTIIIL